MPVNTLLYVCKMDVQHDANKTFPIINQKIKIN